MHYQDTVHDGGNALRAARTEVKAVRRKAKTAERERDRVKGDLSMSRLAKVRLDQEKGEKAKVLREVKAELTKSKHNVTAVEKEKAKLSTKLKKVGDEANQVDVHLSKNRLTMIYLRRSRGSTNPARHSLRGRRRTRRRAW